MINPFKIPPQNQVCHDVLSFLTSRLDRNNVYQPISSNEIFNETILTNENISLAHIYLIHGNEITCTYNENEIIMTLTDNGRHSYISEKYIKEGRKERLTGFALYMQVTIPYLSMIISIVALIRSFYK